MKLTHIRFKSPLRGRICSDDVFVGTPYAEEGYDMTPEVMARIYDRNPALSTMLKDNTADLTEYLPEELKELVFKLELGDYGVFDGQFCLVHHVWVFKEPTNAEMDKIDEYICGQLSDGWGEGLEQIDFESETVTWTTPYFDEYDVSFDTEECRGDVSYYVTPWYRGIELTELDHEEEDVNVCLEEVAHVEFDDETRVLYRLEGAAAMHILFKQAEPYQLKSSPFFQEIEDDIPIYLMVIKESADPDYVYPGMLKQATEDSVFVFERGKADSVCRCDTKYGYQKLLFI